MAKYIKIPSNFFELEPIKAIVDEEKTVLLYLHLLCETHKANKKGVFSICDIALTDRVIESVFRYDSIGERLKTLEQLGLVKRTETSIKVFKPWDDLHDRNSQRYKEWRLNVFKRDGFRCQECGTKKDIQAHHIKPWKNNKSLRYVVSNGITLCRDCHLQAHGGSWKNG